MCTYHILTTYTHTHTKSNYEVTDVVLDYSNHFTMCTYITSSHCTLLKKSCCTT